MSVKIAVLAPIPRASEMITMTAKAWASAKATTGILQIFEHGLDYRQAPLLAVFFFDLLGKAKHTLRRPPRLVGVHAASAVLLCLHFEMEAKLFLKPAVRSPLPKESANSKKKRWQPHLQAPAFRRRAIAPETRSQFARSLASWWRPERVIE
jgi:hypothetical protein